MARYTGPKTKIARKFGEPIYGSDKYFEKRRDIAPGMHGANKRRKKVSEYGTQLQEKQKAKYTYGVLERQFHKTFELARRKEGVTGLILMQLLESRLDNVVYRLGIAPTRAAARQLVNITVNGEILGIPSYLVKVGEIVGVREKSKSLEVITNSLEGHANHFSWLEWDDEKLCGKFMSYPVREEIPENINEQLIVELYSK